MTTESFFLWGTGILGYIHILMLLFAIYCINEINQNRTNKEDN